MTQIFPHEQTFCRKIRNSLTLFFSLTVEFTYFYNNKIFSDYNFYHLDDSRLCLFSEIFLHTKSRIPLTVPAFFPFAAQSSRLRDFVITFVPSCESLNSFLYRNGRSIVDRLLQFLYLAKFLISPGCKGKDFLRLSSSSFRQAIKSFNSTGL